MEKTLLTSLLIILGFGLTVVNGMVIQHRQKRQNYDALLQNKAFVESQINCVLGRGQCDRIGHRIKVLVPEVVQTNVCKSCTEEEKGNVQKVADHVQNNYPKAWNEIKDQYKDEEEEIVEDEAPGDTDTEDIVNEETSDNSVSDQSSATPVPTDKEEEQIPNQDASNQENNQEQDSMQGHQSEEQLEETHETGNQDQEQHKTEETSGSLSKKDVDDTTDNVTN